MGKGGAQLMAISLGTFSTIKGETAKRIHRKLCASVATTKESSDAYLRAKRLRDYREANKGKK